MLVFGLLVTVLVTMQVTFVPAWEHDRELRHMTAVQGQYATMKGQAEAQVANATAIGVTSPILLQEPANYRFFQSGNRPATLSFEPGEGDVEFSAPEYLVLVQAGKSTAGADEEWTSVPGSQVVDDVADVSHLRLRLLDVGTEDDGDSVTISITDRDGNFAGSLTAYIERDPPDQFINTRITRADGEVIYDQGSFYHQTTTIPFWWIDALSPELHFEDVLAAAAAPLTLTLVENGMEGEFTATYVETTTGGIVGGSGRLITNWSESLDSGALRFASGNNELVAQSFILENGGVILEQPDGAVMRIDPALRVATSDTRTSIKITVPALDGPSDSLTGTGTAAVLLDGTFGRHLIGTAPSWTMHVTTQYPAAWAESWARILDGAGLRQGAGEYSIATTAADARLTIYGQTTAPSSTEHDLSVEFHAATVQVRLQA